MKTIRKMETQEKKWFTGLELILLLTCINLVIRLLTNSAYGFHRDEFLYMALGRHLDIGFWSNPPLIGIFAYLSQLLGDSVFSVRFIPAILGAATVFLTGLMVKDYGGKFFAQLIACLAIMLSPAYLRLFSMYNPVPFEVFYWTLLSFLILRYLKTASINYIYALGIVVGLGMMNKYSTIFFVIGILIGLVFTSYRKLFLSKHFYAAIGIAFCICLPNLWWQYSYHFPVVNHMEGLQESQLVNVDPLSFILDQFLMNLQATPIWIAGLIFLLFNQSGKTFRLLGWIFVSVIFLFLVLSGKSYYTLGVFPITIAAGSYYLEQVFGNKKKMIKTLVVIYMFLTSSIVLPLSITFLNADQFSAYCQYLIHEIKLESPMRWEDGQIHALPQDYADMFGWEEFGEKVALAYQQVPNKKQCMIYCENYGQAGAVEHFGKKYNLPPVISFSDSYRLWAPEKIDDNINTLIYVNDELGDDIRAIFEEVKLIGTIEHPYAREQGTRIYLCQKERSDFSDFWTERVKPVFATFK